MKIASPFSSPPSPDASPPVLLRLNKAHYPVTVLGYGRRVGLWVQGCGIRCKGCVSQDTWAAEGGSAVSVAEVLDWCKTKAASGLDGVTLSGGEPFEQPQALAALLDGLARWRQEAGLTFDVLCYSGYPLKTLRARHAALLEKLDALIPEPYADALPQGGAWRGSANQSLIPLSPLGQARYAGKDAPAAREKTIQVALEGERVWMIGIPERGDMAALESLCATRGLSLNQVSWRR
ncbi:MAG: radical SAM protein [Zoogloeaceae bacterium]|jgi:anaerobic ribonucleoside-triphosphate reductase activating protein|nr:radical SAM protein [Zoogloeaceae bacterium]